MTGENVSYSYDSLNRLVAASTAGTAGVQWGYTYGYDGFGNLADKIATKGSAQTVYFNVNSANNQVRASGDIGYDANGNWYGMQGSMNTWNMENQLVSNGSVDGGGNTLMYTYDPWGKRVMQYSVASGQPGTGTLYFYGITGKRLAACSIYGAWPYGFSCSFPLYFGSRPLEAVDRLGSVRANQNVPIAYYPWGEERTTTPDATDKFGTYFRDFPGEDYANARYYNGNMGRFYSPDPKGRKAARPSSPRTWNRYTYANDDPVNRYDPSGTDTGCVGGYFAEEDGEWGDITCGDDGPGSSGGGGGGDSTDLPPLHCEFDAGETVTGPGYWRMMDLGKGQSAPGFGDPITLHYTATGGTGNYTWNVIQVISMYGWTQYDNGDTSHYSSTKFDPTVPSELNPAGPSSATFYDSPGVMLSDGRGGTLVAANLFFNFSTSVYVESGTQFATCPTVSWVATVIIGPSWNPIQPNGTGQATVTGVSQ